MSWWFFQAVDTLVRAFPENEESVRVPLREKYKSLLQRVKKCSVPGMNTQHLPFICQDSCFLVDNVFFFLYNLI